MSLNKKQSITIEKTKLILAYTELFNRLTPIKWIKFISNLYKMLVRINGLTNALNQQLLIR